MRLDRVPGNRLSFEFEKTYDSRDDSAGHLPTSGKRAEGRVHRLHPDHGPVSMHEEDYGDDDVFMDSYAVNDTGSPSGAPHHPEVAAVVAPLTGIQSVAAAQVTSGGEEVSGHSGSDGSEDVSMKSEGTSPVPRRAGRLLRRRLFPKSKAQWSESGGSTGGRNNRPSDASDLCDDLMVAKEKLVSLSQEKLRSYSTDLHSNSDGLRNRVLVESTLKKFLLKEMDSPPRISQPSTPRKRSVTSVSPLSSSPSCPSSPIGPAFAFDDETTRTLSDCIKRMRIMHSSPSSRTSLSLEEEESEVGRDVVHPAADPSDDRSQLHDFPMTDLAAVFRKIHCLTDLPIDSEF